MAFLKRRPDNDPTFVVQINSLTSLPGLCVTSVAGAGHWQQLEQNELCACWNPAQTPVLSLAQRAPALDSHRALSYSLRIYLSCLVLFWLISAPSGEEKCYLLFFRIPFCDVLSLGAQDNLYGRVTGWEQDPGAWGMVNLGVWQSWIPGSAAAHSVSFHLILSPDISWKSYPGNRILEIIYSFFGYLLIFLFFKKLCYSCSGLFWELSGHCISLSWKTLFNSVVWDVLSLRFSVCFP